MPISGRGAARVAIGSRPPWVPGPSATTPVAGSTVRSSIDRIWSTRWCSRHAGAEHQTRCTRSPSRTARGAMCTACRPDTRTLGPNAPPCTTLRSTCDATPAGHSYNRRSRPPARPPTAAGPWDPGSQGNAPRGRPPHGWSAPVHPARTTHTPGRPDRHGQETGSAADRARSPPRPPCPPRTAPRATHRVNGTSTSTLRRSPPPRTGTRPRGCRDVAVEMTCLHGATDSAPSCCLVKHVRDPTVDAHPAAGG